VTLEVVAIAAVLLAPAVMILGSLAVLALTVALASVGGSGEGSSEVGGLSLRHRLIRPPVAGSTD
jgi:hypothetical protein